VDSNRAEWRAWVANWDQKGFPVAKTYWHHQEIFQRSDADVIFTATPDHRHRFRV